MSAKTRDPFEDLAKPVEYKDVPVEFTLILDGREEPVKVVEPLVDLPFPDGARLRAESAGRCLCDVVFHSHPEPDETSCELRFKVFKGIRHPAEKVVTFGCGRTPAPEQPPPPEHRLRILEIGAVTAWVVLQHGKARLNIVSDLPNRSENPVPNSASVLPDATL